MSTIETAFNKLITAEAADFETAVQEVANEFSQWANREGEIPEYFNPILGGGSFSMRRPYHIKAPFLGDAHRAKCVAAVLLKISEQLGWAELNLDAKGWCKSMLQCSIPAKFSKKETDELLEAKRLVSFLIDDLLQMKKRDVKSTSKGGLLGLTGWDD
jgi:hypothetical protein